MNGGSLSWYLCGLFLFALVAESAVSVAPGGNAMVGALMATWATLSVVFAVMAICLRRRSVSRARWLVRSLLGFAIPATAMVLLLAVG
jgi:hypothetical protein